MIAILPNIDLINLSFSNKTFSDKKKGLDILYNIESKICFTRKYIDLLEAKVENPDAYKALVTELYDSGRVHIETLPAKNSIEEEFISIENSSNLDVLIPVANSSIPDIKTKLKTYLVELNNIQEKSREWIALQLATKGTCILSHLDFSSNKEIESFFSETYLIPRNHNQIFIFDRDRTAKYREALKNKNIRYYTIHLKGRFYAHELKPDLLMLKKDLGNKLQLFYTNKRDLLHERKVIIDNLLITADNSMINLLKNSPTWEISITYCPLKSNNWKRKCDLFTRIN